MPSDFETLLLVSCWHNGDAPNFSMLDQLTSNYSCLWIGQQLRLPLLPLDLQYYMRCDREQNQQHVNQWEVICQPGQFIHQLEAKSVLKMTICSPLHLSFWYYDRICLAVAGFSHLWIIITPQTLCRTAHIKQKKANSTRLYNTDTGTIFLSLYPSFFEFVYSCIIIYGLLSSLSLEILQIPRALCHFFCWAFSEDTSIPTELHASELVPHNLSESMEQEKLTIELTLWIWYDSWW